MVLGIEIYIKILKKIEIIRATKLKLIVKLNGIPIFEKSFCKLPKLLKETFTSLSNNL